MQYLAKLSTKFFYNLIYTQQLLNILGSHYTRITHNVIFIVEIKNIIRK